jgi:hypothetical protein
MTLSIFTVEREDLIRVSLAFDNAAESA